VAASNINRVIVSGNLTADPELKETGAGHKVCELRLANNVPMKKEGNWEQKTNFFQINTWGGLAENCAKYLEKGSPIFVDGRLEWQKWEGKDGGTNSRVVITAENVQFAGKRKDAAKSEDTNGDNASEPASDEPAPITDDKDVDF
jgi:single-strand DNA-binding protein